MVLHGGRRFFPDIEKASYLISSTELEKDHSILFKEKASLTKNNSTKIYDPVSLDDYKEYREKTQPNTCVTDLLTRNDNYVAIFSINLPTKLAETFISIEMLSRIRYEADYLVRICRFALFPYKLNLIMYIHIVIYVNYSWRNPSDIIMLSNLSPLHGGSDDVHKGYHSQNEGSYESIS